MRQSKQPEELEKSSASVLAKTAILFSTAFGCGYSKKAPGTIGSIPGLLIGLSISHFIPSYGGRAGIVGLIVLLAIWAIHFTEKVWDTHDDQRIVIDEVAGQAIATAFLPVSIVGAVASFALFRFFDIWKPGPIGWADANLPGVWGTLIDDLIAGVFTAVCCWGLINYVL